MYGLLGCVIVTAVIAALVPTLCIALAYLCVFFQRFTAFILLYSVENIVAITAYYTSSKAQHVLYCRAGYPV